MPMIWNAEADAKLLLGVLNQLKNTKLKLDHEELARFMGPDCLPGAIQNRLRRLRKRVDDPDAVGADSEGEKSTPSTPAGTPQKRKAGRPPRTPSKKVKAEKDGDAGVDDDAGMKEERSEE